MRISAECDWWIRCTWSYHLFAHALAALLSFTHCSEVHPIKCVSLRSKLHKVPNASRMTVRVFVYMHNACVCVFRAHFISDSGPQSKVQPTKLRPISSSFGICFAFYDFYHDLLGHLKACYWIGKWSWTALIHARSVDNVSNRRRNWDPNSVICSI